MADGVSRALYSGLKLHLFFNADDNAIMRYELLELPHAVLLHRAASMLVLRLLRAKNHALVSGSKLALEELLGFLSVDDVVLLNDLHVRETTKNLGVVEVTLDIGK